MLAVHWNKVAKRKSKLLWRLFWRRELVWLFASTILIAASSHSAHCEKRGIAIEGGVFSPLYGLKQDEESVKISSFRIDIAPVTNQEYSRFLEVHPEWGRDKAQSLLVDETYLQFFEQTEHRSNAPLTSVSYFAATEYCAWRGGRLPTTNEWEYVAAADEKRRDASRDPVFVQRLLGWYARPHAADGLGEVKKGTPNAWGVFDLHGLIWEWTQDFNSVFVSSDNRRESDQLKNLFCGVGAVSATDKANYAAFMRYALRSSLQGRYTMENLGFRCAYDD